jgi:hypothetical protein
VQVSTRILVLLFVPLGLSCTNKPSPNADTIDSQHTTPTTSLDHVPADTAGACASIFNSYECAQAKEPALLRTAGGRARREGSTLVLTLANGTVRRFTDRNRGTDSGLAYSYAGYLAPVHLHILHLQGYEDMAYLLLPDRGGGDTFSEDLPIASPDSSRVATAVSDPDAQMRPTGVWIWRTTDSGLVRELDWTIKPDASSDSAWGPTNLSWVTATELLAVKSTINGPVGHLRLRLTASGWTVAEEP